MTGHIRVASRISSSLLKDCNKESTCYTSCLHMFRAIIVAIKQTDGIGDDTPPLL